MSKLSNQVAKCDDLHALVDKHLITLGNLLKLLYFILAELTLKFVYIDTKLTSLYSDNHIAEKEDVLPNMTSINQQYKQLEALNSSTSGISLQKRQKRKHGANSKIKLQLQTVLGTAPGSDEPLYCICRYISHSFHDDNCLIV